MTYQVKCPLCSSNVTLLKIIRDRRYYICNNCHAVLLDPRQYPSLENEKQRYLMHNNDVNNPGYQKFVQPLVDAVKESFREKHNGLDFGSGINSAASKLLKDSGYSLKLYDLFFHNKAELLATTYDYIICCEVIEHFTDPKKEFAKIRSILKAGGKLFCMTSLYGNDIDFEHWYYKDDFTHKFFYHKDTIEWVRTNYNFSALQIKGNLIRFDV